MAHVVKLSLPSAYCSFFCIVVLPLKCDLENFLVFDVWKQYYPQAVDIKHDSIYDYYDVLEQIGE